MSPNVLMIVIAAIVILVVGAVAGYYVLRHMRGSIKLTLAKRGFNPGEKVNGSFELTVRKTIECRRLYAALIGEEVIKERKGDKTRTRRREIFRNEQTIEEARRYPAGHTEQYAFELSTPSTTGPDFLNTALGQTLKMGMKLLSGRQRYLRWKVVVRLDAEGIDLASSTRVTVNIPGAV